MLGWIVNFVAPLLFGACVGSFLNVVIYRLPLNKSLVFPGSHCAACGAPIPWENNIPVLSWFVLGGRAACCGTKIDMRYPMVEAFTAIVFLYLWNAYEPSIAIPYILFACALIVGSCIDMDLMILPDSLTLGFALLGLIFSLIVPELHNTHFLLEAGLRSLVSAIFGGGFLWFIAFLGSVVFRKEAMGMGDVKLMMAFGAFFGLLSCFFIIAVASIIGSVCGIAMMLMKQKRWGLRMPFGPFLAIGAFLWIAGGNQKTVAYFQDMFFMLDIDASWLY